MLAIRIDKCRDPLMWYAKYVGCYVPFVESTIHPGDSRPVWTSREKLGCVNIVCIDDSTIVKVEGDTEFYEPIEPEISLELFTYLKTNEKMLLIQQGDEIITVNDTAFRKEYVKLLQEYNDER